MHATPALVDLAGIVATPRSVTEPSSRAPSEVSLDRLAGVEGRIVRLQLSDSLASRLKAMGLFEGQQVTVSRQGNPLVVNAAGFKIALNRDIASQIFVQTQG